MTNEKAIELLQTIKINADGQYVQALVMAINALSDVKEVPVCKIEFSKEQLQEIVRQAIQKYIDNDAVETRACADCKYYETDYHEEPCRCCCYGDGLDNWEARDDVNG